MRFFPLVLWIAAALLTLTTPCSATPNLVDNGSFEAGEPGQEPTGWTGYAPHGGVKFASDATVAHAGTHSATIETTSDQIGVLVSKAIPVAPGEQLKLSIWMRAPGIKTNAGGMMSLSAGFQDRYGSYFKWARFRFPAPQNVNDWFLVEREITIPERTAKMTFQTGMRFMTGKMYVDDAQLITSNSAVIRFDMQTATLPPGEIKVPMILVNRSKKSEEFSAITEPGAATTKLQAGPGETTVSLPFSLKKRGKVMARVELKCPEGPDFVTSISATVPPLLTTEPLIPTHWLIEDAQIPSCEGRFWIAEPEGTRAGLSARCELVDATSKTIGQWKSEGPLGEEVSFKMSAPAKVDSRTTYTVRVVVERDGKQVASDDLPWRFIHKADTEVTLSEDGYPRVLGKPFFPIGMYMGGFHADLKSAGFNVVQSYSAGFAVEQGERPNNNGILQFLDRAHDNGFRALVFVNHGLATRLGREESLRRVKMFRNHPAMLVWYEEEAVARALKPLSWLAEHVGDMRREGPGHPVLLGDLVDYGVKVKDRSRMLPDELMDIGMWWWYPTPPRHTPVVEDYEGENAGADLEYVPPSFLTQAKTKKPLWIALQCYKKPDAADARFPTPVEYRCQAYLAIISGAKGLYYYTGYGEQGHGILHRQEEGHWKELTDLVRELRTMENVFMAPDSPQQPSCGEKMISLRMKHMPDGKRVLIAVNRCNRKLPGTFTLPHVSFASNKPEKTPVAVRFENRTVSLMANDQLTDEFEPYGTHIYDLP